MASGITVAGRGDLDVLFKARTSAKLADVGIQISGVDISNRYEPRGSTTAIANTNLRSQGVDLASLFMDINAVAATHTLVAGTASGNIGYDTTPGSTYGSLSPTTAFGSTVYKMKHDASYFQFMLTALVAQNFFTSIQINGMTYYTNSTYDYYQFEPQTIWVWSGSAGLVNGNTYPVIMT